MSTRALLIIFFVSSCTCSLAAGEPLTVKEIALMLRSGYSSETVMQDVAARHFAGPLSLESEIRLRENNASPALIVALKNANYLTTPNESYQAIAKQSEAEFNRDLAVREAHNAQIERETYAPLRKYAADMAEAERKEAETLAATPKPKSPEPGSLAARGFGTDTLTIQEKVEKEKREAAAIAAERAAQHTEEREGTDAQPSPKSINDLGVDRMWAEQDAKKAVEQARRPSITVNGRPQGTADSYMLQSKASWEIQQKYNLSKFDADQIARRAVEDAKQQSTQSDQSLLPVR